MAAVADAAAVCGEWDDHCIGSHRTPFRHPLARSGGGIVATIPEILWEASLTFYLIFKGFRDSPIVREMDAED